MLNTISRLGETGPKQEWPKGISRLFRFSGIIANLARYTQNFGMKFRNCLFHSLPHPEFPEFLVEWNVPQVYPFNFPSHKIDIVRVLLNLDYKNRH